MRVKHSVPVHGCFMIILPARGEYRNRCLLVNGDKGEVYELEDIESGHVTKAILLDMFCYRLDELPESLCYLSYGLSRYAVIKALCYRYPNLKKDDAEVEVLILQKQ